MNYKSFFIAILIAGLITTSIISNASATYSVPIKYHSADSFIYNFKYNTNYEQISHTDAASKDWSTYITFDVNKPLNTLDISYTVNGAGGTWCAISFNIPDREKLLIVNRLDVYCDHATLGKDWLTVIVRYDDGTTRSFTADDHDNFDKQIGGTKIKYYTI
ncbi:MAG: hypothetical protein CfClM3_0870 [Methanobrevibacter sp. CfCl-M3]